MIQQLNSTVKLKERKKKGKERKRKEDPSRNVLFDKDDDTLDKMDDDSRTISK